MLKTNLQDTNYRAKIVQLKNKRVHSNANRLLCWNIDFQNVITNLDYNEGDIVVYFPIESEINKDFISFINGFEDKEMNRDTSQKGFFSKKCRVKAISLRSEKSQGFVIPIKVIEEFLGTTLKYKIGEEFDSYNDIVICKKYIPIIKSRNGGIKSDRKIVKRISRLVENQFRLHNDTENLRKNVHKLSVNDYISVHYKKHGTSFVVGNVLTKRKLTWFEKLAQKVNLNIVDTEYDIIYSSRKVVKNQYETKDSNDYYGYDLWADIKEELTGKIPKGITLYGECIGFTKDGGYIQKDYDYKCEPKKFKIYIYRITFTNVDSQVFEFDCKQILEFCEKYNLNYKETFFFYGKVSELFNKLNQKHELWLNPNLSNDRDFQEYFIKLLELEYNEKDCFMCNNNVPEEGIVIRKQNLFDYEAYKLKSARFFEKESKDLDDENYVDLETVESTQEANSLFDN